MRIAIHTLGTRGDVQPYLALAIGLKSRGHDVLMAAPGLGEARSGEPVRPAYELGRFERKHQRPLGALVPGRWLRLVAAGVLEFFDGLAESLRELRQLTATKQQQKNGEDEENFRTTEA